jgi:hypothetical protein
VIFRGGGGSYFNLLLVWFGGMQDWVLELGFASLWTPERQVAARSFGWYLRLAPPSLASRALGSRVLVLPCLSRVSGVANDGLRRSELTLRRCALQGQLCRCLHPSVDRATES